MKRTMMILFLLTAGAAGSVFGTTHLVRPDGSGDFPTIGAAMLASAPGDTVLLADGTFVGADNRNLDFAGKPLVIRSESQNPESCVIDCQHAGRGFLLQSGEGNGAILEGLTIFDGASGYGVYGGGIYCANGSSPRVLDCRLVGNHSGYGGGIFCADGSSPQILGCDFLWNHANYGGGISCQHSSRPEFTDCTFDANIGARGAGIYCDDGCSISLKDCILVNHTETGFGGAMECANNSPPVITGCTFAGNYAYVGGAVYCWGESSPTIANSTFYNNGAEGGGSVRLYSTSEPMVMTNCVLAFGPKGGAVSCYAAGTPIVTCCDIFGNVGGDWTGCIAGLEGIDGNFSANPLFCDAPHGVFTLSANSPCAAENNPECEQIGRWPFGCGLGCTLAYAPQRIITYYPGGAPLTYTLSVADAFDLGAFSLCAGFNGSLLQIDDVVIDPSFLGSTGRTVQPLDPAPCSSSCGSGGIRFGATTSGAQPGPFGAGNLATISLRRTADGAGQDTLCADNFLFTTTASPPETLRILTSPSSVLLHRNFCYGDFNDDGDVSIMDIMQVVNRWGCVTGQQCYNELSDVNLIAPGDYAASLPDGRIDVIDVQAVAGRWRLGCPGATPAKSGNGLRTAESASLSIFPSQLRIAGEVGDTTSFAVIVQSGSDLGAFELSLSFDPALIRIEDVEVAPLLSSTGRSVYPLAWAVDEAKRELKLGAWSLGEAPGPSGDGVLARVTVSLASCPGWSEITIPRAALAGSLGWPQGIAETTGGRIVTECSPAAADASEELPRKVALYPPRPNPFARSTSIGFDLPAPIQGAGLITLQMVDVAGRVVRRLASSALSPGRHALIWDGRSDAGEVMPSGIYFCRLKAGGKVIVRPTVLLR